MLGGNVDKLSQRALLSEPPFERDSCGVGLVANINGVKSRGIISDALTIIKNLEHRCATGADEFSGDGAGITIQMPNKFLQKVTQGIGLTLPKSSVYGVGMLFLPMEQQLKQRCMDIVERVFKNSMLRMLGWRSVAVDASTIGLESRAIMPSIYQCFVTPLYENVDTDNFERQLFLARKRIEKEVERSFKGSSTSFLHQRTSNDFYICSLSSRLIVYKGMLLPSQISRFFKDLNDPELESAFGLVHSRFSTNTLGSWRLAHPQRFIAHNGEINTVRGNRNWMLARESTLQSNFYKQDIKDLLPICNDDDSDTASFDNVLELLLMSGRDISHATSMMIPAAWYGNRSMSREVQEFYEYHFGIMEPWDGPAMMVMTDGEKLCATLDRNGFRPFRYCVTKDNKLIMASETGVLPIPPDMVLFKDRLAPGRLFTVDFAKKRIVPYKSVIKNLATQKPYGEWLKNYRLNLTDIPNVPPPDRLQQPYLQDCQIVFGYTREDLNMLITPMAEKGSQPVGSMGNDAPLAVLSNRPQPLFHYFKQLFAQVSNPPLDAIREKLVTQVSVVVGKRGNLLEETPEHCALLRIDKPILNNTQLATIQGLKLRYLRTKTVSTLLPIAMGTSELDETLNRIHLEAEAAIDEGYTVILLSDRGVNAENTYVPSLLAVSSLHHYLIRRHKRLQADIVLESGEPREVHHFATLFGYGASAINPYLALDTIAHLWDNSDSDNGVSPSKSQNAQRLYIEALESGVVKTIAKMGISTLQGYIGAQQFEAIGVSQELIDKHFTRTASRIGGIGTKEIKLDLLTNHARAFDQKQRINGVYLDEGGLYHWRTSGENHSWNPNTITLLQYASKYNDWHVYERFEEAVDTESNSPITIRQLLEPNYTRKSIPLEEVEPVTEIVKRFATGAISLGSISKEAHETIAIGMNRLGARSNTGEGGEDPSRFVPEPNGDFKNSAVKQIASGRFGVTTNYLANSKDIQIKMAQGAKPGEGGEIPGHKISSYIAEIRKTTPGVELISPPPHHDIYSIEDLAQLIYDMKNVNPQARINVKLVSEVGVGIIAAGVAKAKADVVLISGDSGGTGASPLSSIRHAGLPWELGVAETHQVLVANRLRDRIVVQTDGQIKTGMDVIVATLLGAEEWGVATASLVVLGCIMLRKCHLNTCSVGIATQDPQLREKFAGTPEAVVNYFMMLAKSVRIHMAKLGFKNVNQMVGASNLLKVRTDIQQVKANTLNLSRLLTPPKLTKGAHNYNFREQNHKLHKVMDKHLLDISQPAIQKLIPVKASLKINNSNRSVGAMLSGVVAKNYSEQGLPEGSINIKFQGAAGQSFGAFLVKGIEFKLEGDANDYFGKGLSGGRLIVVPPANSTYIPEDNVIIGNVSLYGATGGEAYIRGQGGERFCVRNSAAIAVIEGIGDHGCEYMTGGRACIIGKTGRNFASGMTGGIAYVFDSNNSFSENFNNDTADIKAIPTDSENAVELKQMLEQHFKYTQSQVAQKILTDWNHSLRKFVMIIPRDYARVLAKTNYTRKQKTVNV